MSFFKVCMWLIRSPIVGHAVLQEEQVKFIIEISSLLFIAANNASNIFLGIIEQYMQYHLLTFFTVYALSLHCAQHHKYTSHHYHVDLSAITVPAVYNGQKNMEASYRYKQER